MLKRRMSKIMSDVQSDQSINYDSLDFVGMSDIQTTIRIQCHQQDMNVPAKLRLGVGLIEGHRGIHMSRLFQLHLDHIFNQNLTISRFLNFSEPTGEATMHSLLTLSISDSVKAICFSI